jgi:transcriptional regulator PpsR
MDDFVPQGLPHTFTGPTNWLDNLTPEVAGRLITGASDIALVIDKDGIIEDVALGNDELTRQGYNSKWVGQAWVDTVTVESRTKVSDLLKDAAAGAVPRFREVNHPCLTGLDVPIRYSAVRIGSDGRTVALGRDLRNLSNLQQRLVEAQQTMEREYARMRVAETRYRMLFHLASEPVVIVDATTFKIIEANPAAQKHIITGSEKLVNESVLSAFTPASADALQAVLTQARISGRSEEIKISLANNREMFAVSASMFRQENTAYLLVRMTPQGVEKNTTGTDANSIRILNVLEQLPDGFVVIDPELNILEANYAFLDMVQLASKPQALGQPLERWLGRPGIDMQLLMANLSEHGAVRNFSTIMRGTYGGSEEVEVSAVPALTGEIPSYGFVIRSIGVRTAVEGHSGRSLPRSVEHLTELVGRVTLKELVRETTDVIERLCIEAALELSKDNRASAAQMLGLSRQSFYAKMRRHGLGDLDSDETELSELDEAAAKDPSSGRLN